MKTSAQQSRSEATKMKQNGFVLLFSLCILVDGLHHATGMLVLKSLRYMKPWMEDFHKVFQEQNPDIKSMRDVEKACGEKWKMMTYEEKVKYYDIATEKQAEFDRTVEEYIK
ncbi:high mobility group B protein 14 [Gossypium hirsutum]|uniref:High mobility group B protein 14 n=1 Tax=Gossypium hirsutum TaxID=3635 RepID=A0ABM3BWE8_GOSHI|nr:high mobility group B protein 14-like [Gossypium hirsutum]